MEGNIMIKRGAESVEYEPGLMVLAGDTFQTIGESRLVIEYLDDGTLVELEPHTTLLFNDNAGGKKTNIASGTAIITVPRQQTDQPMTLTSYNSDALVLEEGKFIQKYTGLETSFEVISGQLQVRRFSDGKVTDVRAGESHSCRPDGSGIIQFEMDGLE
jgi:ferric-dicitrate binding protein FerR (iron transport regulator)